MSPVPTITALTLNIWHRSDPWETRLGLIRQALARLRPDVVGLQEVLSNGEINQAQEIATGLGYEVVYGPAKEWGGGIFFGNAVLTRLPVREASVLDLPCLDSGDARSLLHVSLQLDERTLPFCVTHLSWKFHEGYVREAQVLAAARYLDRSVPRNDARFFPPILVGDFNASPETAEVRFLRGLQTLDGTSAHFLDAFGEAGVGPGVTFDGPNNPFAAVAEETPRRIDYVLVRGQDDLCSPKVREAHVVLSECTNGICASDHYGVMATLRF